MQVSARFSDVDQPGSYAPVVAVGTVLINLVVVTRIAESAGLRSVAHSPAEAQRLLPTLKPAILVIDGGANDQECDALLEAISLVRRSSDRGHPRVLFLATGLHSASRSLLQPIIDTVVAKPIIPDRLQPLLVALARQVG